MTLDNERSAAVKNRKTKVIVGVIIAAIIILFLTLAEFFTNLLWFQEMGYVNVFLKELITQLEFGIPGFLVITLLCYVYLMAIKKRYYKKVVLYEMSSSEKSLNRSALLISGIFGVMVAFALANRLWFQILQFINSTDFGIIDPIFQQDVSFYIFKLEFLQQINNLLIWIILGFAAVNVIYYFILLAKRKPNGGEYSYTAYDNTAKESAGSRFYEQFKNGFGAQGGNPFENIPRPSGPKMDKADIKRLLSIAGIQLKVLGVLFFLMVAAHFYLKQYSLLYTGSTSMVFGAGFTDIHVLLWVYRIQMVLALAGAVLFVLSLSQGKLKRILLIPAGMIGVFIIGIVSSALVQNLIVEPDEINKEYPYLESNIAFTRYAYDLQDITTETYDVEYDLTADSILDNAETIANIRINDYEPALKYYNQTQSIRLYYNFNDVDVDRYYVDGEYTQTFLSARELDEATISDSWLNSHLKYTHGYGVTLSRVDKVTESGQPDMLIDSIPPVSQVPEIEFANPEIYFGEDTHNYVIVGTNEQEFDYPSGDSNVYTTYEGNAGIKMNLLNRILFSLRMSDLQLLVSTNITNDSKIIINREINNRVRTIAPFLAYDDDPYIVAADGGLYWIFDAYTTSSYYPYSEPIDSMGVNYIRNSVKVVVDAYNGSVDFYVVDNDDPIALTLQKIYPDLFKDLDQMPDSLQAHLRYPQTMFTIQADVYSKYHMVDVDTFYQNEDRWDISNEIYGTAEVPMTATYYIMTMPGEREAEFILSIPYTPSGKDNLTAILIARNDGDHYGELMLYQMPKDVVTYGPSQVEALINQDTKIAQDFTLWSSAGSTYTRGNMFVILIDGSLMYVEPIYLESANSSIPEVKRVVIYYDGRIAYEDTLAEALDSMFGKGASAVLGGEPAVDVPDSPEDSETPDIPEVVIPSDLDMDELAAKANEAFLNAVEAQQRGDWAAYGEYLDELSGYLSQMVTP